MVYNRERYLKNRESYIRCSSNWNKRNPKKHKSNTITSNRNRYHEIKNQLFDLLARKCSKCQFNDIRALQFDHINSGGRKDYKRFKNSPRFMYEYYIKHPDEARQVLQVLCANCNWIKRHENNECKPK